MKHLTKHGDSIILRRRKKGEIFLVTAEKYARLDAKWLQIGRIYLEGIFFAEQYWQGLPTDDPDWEYLLSFPVTVVKKIE
jgi:hypothetical protein